MPSGKSNYLSGPCETLRGCGFCSFSDKDGQGNQVGKNGITLVRGQRLFSEGDRSHGIYCVSKGLIKLERVSKFGGVRLLNVLGAGDLAGCRALFTDSIHPVTASALEDTTLCFIPGDVIHSLIEKNPKFSLRLLGEISQEAKRNDDRLYKSSELPARGRVADTLLFLKESFQSRRWTRAEMAAWAGTTTETVVRCLLQFEREGLIVLNGHRIEITNKSGLQEIIRL